MMIGLTGYAQSGKNSVANILRFKGYEVMSFADPIRQTLFNLNPMVGEIDLQRAIRFYGWEGAKKSFPEVRGLMQRMGTEVGRNLFGQNFWVDIAMLTAPLLDDVVFTDVRFPNEADAIANRGGQIWRVQRRSVGPLNAHASENSMNDYPVDLVINNDYTLETLTKIVEDAYQTL